MIYPPDLKDRLFRHREIDPKTGCWNWVGASGAGYGRLTIGSLKDGTRKLGSAHRVSYEIFVGAIPAGLFICHKCDNRKCFNPDHLFAGSQQDNIRDAVQKGRFHPPVYRGDGHPCAKLTPAEILEIRTSRLTARELAEKFRMSESHMRNLKRGLAWACLGGAP